MTSYDYKVVPAPRRARKIKGVRGADELFATTLAEAINEVARQGWEYIRTETLVAEGPGGWFRRGSASDHPVMIFRRARESAGPRLAAVGPVQEAPRGPELAPAGERPRPAGRPPERAADRTERAADRAIERVVVDRLQSTLRHQPVRFDPDEDDDAPPGRPGPRLGPADQP